MADLPYGWVQPDLPPFTHGGIDYFGPLLVKSKATVKSSVTAACSCG